jgi:hypothetical protein
MDGHKTVRAVFYTVVTNPDNAGPGSLREALLNADDGSGVTFSVNTVTLTGPLPEISVDFAFEGNGAALTHNGFTESTTSQLLRITGAAAEVRISRLRFKGGRATTNGGAIYNTGKLILESCIFSDNRTTIAAGYGGALYNTGDLTVSGCTFYGNSAGTTGGRGGAIYNSGGTSILTGNVFWGNTANQYPVVYGTATSGGYNVSDKANGTNVTLGSGWVFTAGDKQLTSLPLSPLSFKPIGGLGANGLEGIITTRPEDYPETDFNGQPIQIPGAAGAVQTVSSAGFVLDYGSEGSGRVTVPDGTVDADGLVAAGSSVTLTAVPDEGEFKKWTVDGADYPAQVPPEQLTLTINAHTKVRAVFSAVYRVTNTGNSGTGSLREILLAVPVGETVILPPGETITLTAPLSAINKSIIIEGNGATLTQTGFTASGTSQLLYINAAAAEVRISRLHFKGGRATDYGAAIRNTGKLTLESCIFSDNQESASSAWGGAIYTSGNLTVLGCTFYGNSAGTLGNTQGGAIYRQNGTLTLTGNIFWENTAKLYPVVYGAVTSNGYNVSDMAGGTSPPASASGWVFKTTPSSAADVQLSGVSFDTGFKPSHGSLPVVPASSLTGFPALYFDGTNRGTSSAPGAMPAQ